MTMLDFIVKSLATWRLTNLVHNEEGPFQFFTRLRAWLGIHYDSLGPIVVSRGLKGEIAKAVVNCFLCASIWGAIVVFLIPTRLLYPLAYSTVAILIHKYHGSR